MTGAKRCKCQRIFLAVLVGCFMLSQLNVLHPFPRFLSSTSVGTVRHVKAFIDDDKEINKKDVPTETDLVHDVSHKKEVKIENTVIQPSAHSDKGEASPVPTNPDVNHGVPKKTTTKLSSRGGNETYVDVKEKEAEPLKLKENYVEPEVMTAKLEPQGDFNNTVDVAEKVAEPPKPEENHGKPNKTMTKLVLLEESDKTVDKKGKVAVPLKPEVNNGEPNSMATKPTAQGESEIAVNDEGKVAVPSKQVETYYEPKVTTKRPALQGGSDNAVDDGRKVAEPSKPKEKHDESKVQGQKSASQGGSVGTVDGGRKGDEGEPESTGKSNSKKVANIKEQPSFERIVLLGERHSGTTYTTSVLKRCFPSLRVDDFLIRYKHWFQPDPEFVVDITKQYLTQKGVRRDGDMVKIVNQWPKIAALDDPKSMAFNQTLVIVMFRNAFDWLDSMKKGPHHWTNHFKSLRHNKPKMQGSNIHWYGPKLLSWNEFVAANMTVGATNAGSSQLCQNAYRAGMVSPCIKSKETYPPDVKKDYGSNLSAAPDVLPFNGHNVIYEHDANGEPFQHPLELRTAKIENFLDIPNKWDLGSFLILQHEEINMNGTGALLERVSKIVGTKPSCNADPPKRQPSKKLDDQWTKWILEHADWETEAKVGYQRRAGAQPVRKTEATQPKRKANPPGSNSKK